MKILAFAGSNSKNSINKALVTYTASLFHSENTEVLDLNDYEVPIYGVDLESEIGIPKAVTQFANKISVRLMILLVDSGCSLIQYSNSQLLLFL